VHIADVRKMASQFLASGDAPADTLAHADTGEMLVTLPGHK
jgi:hypothetical protein